MLPDKKLCFLASPDAKMLALKMLSTMIMTSLEPKTFTQRILTAQPASTEIICSLGEKNIENIRYFI